MIIMRSMLALHHEIIISQLANDQTTMSNKFTLISKMLDSFTNTTEVLNQNSVVLDERLKIVEYDKRVSF